MNDQRALTNGSASAAFVASGIGCTALGFITTLAEMNTVVKSLLNWWNPVGPLSGKTSLAVILWLVSWIILHAMWKDKEPAFTRTFLASLLLIAIGLLGTFPPFFEAMGQ